MIDFDMTKTFVWQEGLEEGRKLGRAEVRKKQKELLDRGRQLALEEVTGNMLEAGRSIEEIAFATKLTPAQIRKVKKKARQSP